MKWIILQVFVLLIEVDMLLTAASDISFRTREQFERILLRIQPFDCAHNRNTGEKTRTKYVLDRCSQLIPTDHTT